MSHSFIFDVLIPWRSAAIHTAITATMRVSTIGAVLAALLNVGVVLLLVLAERVDDLAVAVSRPCGRINAPCGAPSVSVEGRPRT